MNNDILQVDIFRAGSMDFALKTGVSKKAEIWESKIHKNNFGKFMLKERKNENPILFFPLKNNESSFFLIKTVDEGFNLSILVSNIVEIGLKISNYWKIPQYINDFTGIDFIEKIITREGKYLPVLNLKKLYNYLKKNRRQHGRTEKKQFP